MTLEILQSTADSFEEITRTLLKMDSAIWGSGHTSTPITVPHKSKTFPKQIELGTA